MLRHCQGGRSERILKHNFCMVFEPQGRRGRDQLSSVSWHSNDTTLLEATKVDSDKGELVKGQQTWKRRKDGVY